MAILQVELG